MTARMPQSDLRRDETLCDNVVDMCARRRPVLSELNPWNDPETAAWEAYHARLEAERAREGK